MLRLVKEARVTGVLVLVYLDDVLVLGYGKGWLGGQAAKIADHMRACGAIVSPKSTLDAVTGIAWIGKSFDLQNGAVSTAKGNWQALLARWWQLASGPCTRRRLLRFLGILLWFLRAGWGSLPFVSRLWAHILWQPQWMADTPVRLLHTLAGLLPWGLMQWKPMSILRGPRDWASCIFFDGAKDGGYFAVCLGWRQCMCLLHLHAVGRTGDWFSSSRYSRWMRYL